MEGAPENGTECECTYCRLKRIEDRIDTILEELEPSRKRKR